MTTKPWQPASKLKPVNRQEGYRYRYVHKDNLARMQDEGWEVVTKGAAKKLESNPVRTLDDGTPLDSVEKVRDLILCRMPEEVAKQRDAYYRKRSEALMQSSMSELRKAADGSGTKAFGEVNVTKPESVKEVKNG
jgi:hypothetical protein